MPDTPGELPPLVTAADPGAIEVRPWVTAWAFLFRFFCTPTGEIDGRKHPAPWGAWSRSPPAAGRHTVRVYFAYACSGPETGASRTAVEVGPGETARVQWDMPPLMSARGDMRVLPRR